MAFGSRPHPEPSSRAASAQRARRCLASTCALCVLFLGLASCSPSSREARFSSALSEIDRRLAEGRSAAGVFAAASKRASSGADWLSLIGRSLRAEAAGDAGRAAAIAGTALHRAPGVEAVAFGAGYALLRSGHPTEVLALFPDRLSRDARPELWAEAVVACARVGQLPSSFVGPENMGFLGTALGEPRLYVTAAVLARERGDAAGAATWLRRAVDAGLEPPATLMWDCGLYDALAARADTDASPGELCLMGDAAWETGDFALAQERWERAIAKDPRVSWKVYVKLGLLAGTGTELQASYFNRLRAAFVDLPAGQSEPEAVAAYAGYRARSGDSAGALKLLKPYAQDVAAGAVELAIEGLGWPENRLVSEAERFAAERPSSGVALGTALRVLFERGRFADMAILYRTGLARGLDYPYRWYYGAALEACQARYAEAIRHLRSADPNDAGAEAPFALGTLYLRQGEPAEAIASLDRARSEAIDSRTRCSILKELGRAKMANGDSLGALAAWQEAARVDPRDPEAAMLARSGSAAASRGAPAGK